MAGFVVSPNTIRMLVHQTVDGRPQLNVLHAEYVLVGPLNPSIAENIWTAVKANLTANAVAAHWATNYTMTGIEVLDLRSPNNLGILSTSAAVTGTGAEPALPAQNCIVVTLRTGKTGRSFRGRVYTFGYTTAALTPLGAIDSAASFTAKVIVDGYQSALSSQAATLAIRSPAKPDRPAHGGGTLPATEYFITPVVSTEVRDTIWDTNRRRLDLLRR